MKTPEMKLAINHDSIRKTGEVMARHVGAMATQGKDHQAHIQKLNELFDEVPFTELCQEDDKLALERAEIENESKMVGEQLRIEVEHLNKMVETFKEKKAWPWQLKAAKEAVDAKKEIVIKDAEDKRSKITRPLESLDIKREQLSITLGSVPTAWPIKPYTEDTPNTVFELSQEYSEANEEDTEFIDETAVESTDIQTTDQTKEKELGPFAELAKNIPSLSERLKQSISEHSHVYERVKTAKEELDEAAAKSPEERSDEEAILIGSIYILKTRFLMNPADTKFLEVYEAKDVIGLAQKLRKFTKKNRPDFNDLEGQILDKASAEIKLLDKNVPNDIKGAATRMAEDKPGRRGMTWQSLSKHASRACDTMRARFFAGGSLNTHLKNYIVEVGDHSGTKPDISWLYQFIADDHAFEILGRRRTDKQAATLERCQENNDIISEWVER